MVEFCTACGTSLPKGDLTFRQGKMFTSSDYLCPHCGKTANPTPPGEPAGPAPEATAESDLVIRKGKAETQ